MKFDNEFFETLEAVLKAVWDYIYKVLTHFGVEVPTDIFAE